MRVSASEAACFFWEMASTPGAGEDKVDRRGEPQAEQMSRLCQSPEPRPAAGAFAEMPWCSNSTYPTII